MQCGRLERLSGKYFWQQSDGPSDSCHFTEGSIIISAVGVGSLFRRHTLPVPYVLYSTNEFRIDSSSERAALAVDSPTRVRVFILQMVR
jgi:hypothetical protein